jgi:hypothetical protein
MIAKTLVGLALTVTVSVNPGEFVTGNSESPVQMSERQKTAILRPLVRSTTDCVVRAVASDPRLGKTDVTELIVDSFKSCVDPVRALIEAHDRYYGAGTGEQFFMGPYLDALPATVTAIVKDEPR